LNDSTIIQNEVKDSKYLAKYVAGKSDDWSFCVKEGRITGIGIGGENGYNMVGLSYWKKADSEKIANAVFKKYQEAGHETLFWDEVVNELLEQMYVGICPVTDEQMIEIDTVDELKQIDGSYEGWSHEG